MKKTGARKGAAAAKATTIAGNQDASNSNIQKYIKEYNDADRIFKVIEKAESGKPGAPKMKEDQKQE